MLYMYKAKKLREAAPSIDGEGRVAGCARLREYFIAIGNLEGVNLNTGMGMGRAAATPRRDEEICG